MIYPIQPYFVMQSDVYYKRQMSECGIAHFYHFVYTGHRGMGHYVVPDGAIDIIFSCLQGEPSAQMCGPVTLTSPAIFTKGGSYFGVRLLPGWFDNFGSISAREMVDLTVPLSEVMGDNALTELVALNPSFQNQVDSFIAVFREYAAAASSRLSSGIVRSILHEVMSRDGQVQVNQLQGALNYSRRHLQRTFASTTGLGLKRFCRIMRFQGVLRTVNQQTGKSLSDLAVESGYYDQAHFLKDFWEFAATSPSSYQTMLKQAHYQDRIVMS